MSNLVQIILLLLAAAAAVLLLVTAAVSYAMWRIIRPPENAPDRFLKRGRSAPGQRVVVCVGASMVQGRVGTNFVDQVARRFPTGFDFVNAGVNGDTLYHVQQRLDKVIACQPDDVVMLVGTNDIISTLDPDAWRMYRGAKRLDQPPSLESYGKTLREVVQQVKTWSKARIALCSLPVLGEDLASLANQRVREFNAEIQRIAGEEGVSYLPVFERESALLAERRGQTPGPAFVGQPRGRYQRLMFLTILRHYLLGSSFDALSRRNGLLLKTDLIHGSSQEAALIAGEIEAFLKQERS